MRAFHVGSFLNGLLRCPWPDKLATMQGGLLEDQFLLPVI